MLLYGHSKNGYSSFRGYQNLRISRYLTNLRDSTCETIIGNLFGSFLALRSESRARLTVTRLHANIRTGITSLKSNSGCFESGLVSGFVSVSLTCWSSSKFCFWLSILWCESSLILLDGFSFGIF